MKQAALKHTQKEKKEKLKTSTDEQNGSFASGRVVEYMRQGRRHSDGFLFLSQGPGLWPYINTHLELWNPSPGVLKLQLCFYRCRFHDPQH